MSHNYCPSTGDARAQSMRRLVVKGAFTLGACMVFVAQGYAQQGGGSSWTQAVQALQAALTGPIATGLALLAVIIAGPMCAFGESTANRAFAGVIFTVGAAIGALNFLSWVFP